jgi:hypothetical protein
MTGAAVTDYAPAHLIHDALCKDAPAGLITFRAQALNEAYPTSQPHICFDRDTVAYNRLVVAEPVEYEPHIYQPSTLRPPGASRWLCRICRGTHGEETS